MLKKKKVNYKDLCLDPKNPRLASSFSVDQFASNGGIEDAQEELEKLFSPSDDTDKNSFTNIDDLKKSMRRIGYVGIQNIIVRELPEINKFLVIEGNRRVAAIKALINEDKNALPNTAQKIDDELKKTLENLEVMVLKTEGRSEAEIQKEIKITLGLRHIGGQLEWDALPKGNNIYLEYMKLMPAGSDFEWDAGKGSNIADILAINSLKVRNSLLAYKCYSQMGIHNPSVQPHHYSLILSCVTNTHLKTYEFISLDLNTFELTGDSADRLSQICEFEERDKRQSDKENSLKDPKKMNILREPKSVRRLGLILKDSKYHAAQSVKDTAATLFQEVLNKEKSLDQASSELTAFKKNTQWVQSIEKLINKQQEESSLNASQFVNAGDELELKVKLQRLIKRFKMLMED